MQHRRKKAGLLKSALLGGAVFGAFSLAGAGVAQAAPISWNFYNVPINGVTNGNLGTSTGTFNSDNALYPLPITATGYALNNTKNGYNTTTLHEKTPLYGTQEAGLGLQNFHSYEIVPGTFIQLDISNLTMPPLTALYMTFQSSSTTGTDAWKVWGTKTSGDSLNSSLSTANAASLASGNNQNDIATANVFDSSGTRLYNYIDVTATSGNILIHKLDNQLPNKASVPEPGSLVLLGTGLFGLGLVARRRRRKA